jgi:group II intron reverse transcriptase/maturase
VRNTVSNLQSKLYHAAKQSLARKFGALYDKVYREDILFESWRQVRSNKGAPGIDRIDFEYIEAEIGVDIFLKEIQKELKDESYKAEAVLRCWIDKPGKTEKRPLGIPIIKDRIVQMALKLVIEPIFEANFLECSYGFRPKRSAHQAIDKIRRTITFERQTTVIDADIKGYFDNIRHDILLDLIGRRINDKRVLNLIRNWLKAGVMDNGKYFKGDGTGTPQGGVISPLLANIYLHSFDKMFQLSGIAGTLVRYADDFVILLKGGAKSVFKKIEAMLERLGLKLHPDKSKIVKAKKGFDFLGIHFRLSRTRKKNSKLKQFCQRWASNRSMERIKARVIERIGRRYSLSLEELITSLNPVIRGWNNYFKKANLHSKRFQRLNVFVRERIRIFLKRKYSDSSRGCRRLHDNLLVRLGLCQFG